MDNFKYTSFEELQKINECQHIKPAKFGIEVDLYYKVDEEYDKHGSSVNQNIENFITSINSKRTHVDRVYLLCKDDNQLEKEKKDYIVASNGKPPPKYLPGSIHRALYYAVSTGVMRYSLQECLNKINDISAFYGEFKNDENILLKTAKNNNVPYFSLADILGRIDIEKKNGLDGYRDIYRVKPLHRISGKKKNKYDLSYFFKTLKHPSKFLFIYDPYVLNNKGQIEGIKKECFLGISVEDKEDSKDKAKGQIIPDAFKELNLRLSSWLSWIKDTKAENVNILSVASWGLKKEIVEKFEKEYLKEVKKRLKSISNKREEIDKKLSEQKKQLDKELCNIEYYKKELSRLIDIDAISAEEEFFLEKDISYDSNEFEKYSKISKMIESCKIEKEKLEIQFEEEVNNDDSFSEITAKKFDEKEIEIKELIQDQNSSFKIIINEIEDFIKKKEDGLRDYDYYYSYLRKNTDLNTLDGIDINISKKLKSIKVFTVSDFLYFFKKYQKELINQSSFNWQKNILDATNKKNKECGVYRKIFIRDPDSESFTHFLDCEEVRSLKEYLDNFMKENRIDSLKDKLSELACEQDSLILILGQFSNFKINSYVQKQDLTYADRLNLHDRIYFNDHTILSWGKGFDIFEDRVKFSQKEVSVDTDSLVKGVSLFNPEDRDVSSDKRQTDYALFGKLADSMFKTKNI